MDSSKWQGQKVREAVISMTSLVNNALQEGAATWQATNPSGY